MDECKPLAHGKRGEAMRYFRKFVDKAGAAGLLPEWWDDSHTAGVGAYTRALFGST